MAQEVKPNKKVYEIQRPEIKHEVWKPRFT